MKTYRVTYQNGFEVKQERVVAWSASEAGGSVKGKIISVQVA